MRRRYGRAIEYHAGPGVGIKEPIGTIGYIIAPY
jgi:hypothetical protein